VRFEGNHIHVSGRAGRIPIDVVARLEVDADWLRPRLEHLRVAGVPLPPMFFRAVTDRDVPLFPNRDWPFRFNFGRIEGDGESLKVGA
jgi:hypothetical protein